MLDITFRLVVCVRPTQICCLYLVSVYTLRFSYSCAVAAPAIWNILPSNIRNFPSVYCFRRHLKTFFYNL